MKLDVLTKEQCERVRIWRNECLETLRTPYPLTKEMQEAFYQNVICNRNSLHRYWSIWGNYKKETPDYRDGLEFVGMGGITNLQWENSIGEISLIINPECRKQGLGERAVDLLLDQAFNYLNLQTVLGECYKCNPAWEFWQKITTKYTITNYKNCSTLRNRKYWNGKYYDSLYFTIDRDHFYKVHSKGE